MVCGSGLMRTVLMSSRMQVLTLLIVHAGMLGWSATVNSPTWDESNHIYGGLQHWQSGNMKANPGNPPLPNMFATMVLAGFGIPSGSHPQNFLDLHGEKALTYIWVARLTAIPFSLLGAYACFLWARRLYGHASGLMALVLWCFSPDVLAHGQLITCDMAAMSIGVMANYLYWRWLSERSWSSAALAGLGLGAAEVSKYVWVIALPLWFTLWVVWKVSEFGKVQRHSLLRDIGQLTVIFVLCVYVINLAYGFEGSFSLEKPIELSSKLLKPVASGAPGENWDWKRVCIAVVKKTRILFPANYLGGADQVVAVNEQSYGIYLHGVWKLGGWSYFYLYGFAVKLPVGLWLLIGLSTFLPQAWTRYSRGWRNELNLLLPIAFILLFVTLVTTAQYLRYALPLLPFVLIWVSKLACAFSFKDRSVGIAVVVSTVMFVASSVATFPHSLSYFNEFVGGPLRGHDHMVDANYDWGQDFYFLKRWLDKHPYAKPIRLAHFGQISQNLVGIPQTPQLQQEEANAGAGGPVPGCFAVSATFARGGFGRGLGYLERYQPIDRAGYAILIYYLDLKTVNEIRRSRGVAEMQQKN